MKEDETVWQLLAAFSLSSEAGSDHSAAEAVAAAVASLALPPERLEALTTAVAEATLNAIEHGNGFRATLPVHIFVQASDGAVSVIVADHGRGPAADPPHPDLEAKLAGRQTPRGWGLFLIEQMVDELRRRHEAGHYIVELIVHRQPRPAAPKGQSAYPPLKFQPAVASAPGPKNGGTFHERI